MRTQRLCVRPLGVSACATRQRPQANDNPTRSTVPFVSTDEARLTEVRQRRPLDEALAAAVSEVTSSPEAARAVREDEAAVPIASHVHTEPGDATS